MAIWQFRLNLIPERSLRAKYDTIPVIIPEDMAEDFPWWREAQPPVGFEKQIDSILVRADYRPLSMCIWGDEDANYASIGYEDDTRSTVEWVAFSIDVRNVSIDFVKGICNLASRLKCQILTRQYHLLAPDIKIVLAAIHSSTAKRFVEDPVSTLRGLKRNEGEIIQLPDKADAPPEE
jgi:hypothetical protein